jgi:hypothetical protein
MLVPLVALALLAPTSALAETFSFGPDGDTFARLQGTHGYRVNFSENDRGYFSVRVKGHGSTTDFATKTKRVSADRVRANFGRRGKFDLRFVAAGKPESFSVSAGCEGGKGTFQPGYLVGRAHFRTERGFARIRVHRIEAAREFWPRQLCDSSWAGFHPGHSKKKRTILSATAATYASHDIFAAPVRSLTFRATEFSRHAKPADRQVAYLAELRERAGRVSIHRKMAVVAPDRSLLFPGGAQMPEEIATKPPAPLLGSAEFLRTPESTYTWSGDLAVAFPGIDPIRLTGSRFDVQICSAKGCVAHEAERGSSGS